MACKKLGKEWRAFCVFIRGVPAITVTLFVLSVFCMNLLANKSVSLPFDWLALDCGIIVSWFAFFTMDIVTKHYGPKAATELTLLAISINLVFCLFLYLGSLIPGAWGESYSGGDYGEINSALNKTFGGSWYVVLGSTVAFAASAVINNFLNYAVGKLFRRKPDGMAAYVMRSYVSTAIGQFADNLIFAFIVSHIFFGWSAVQCVTCAATGMVVELLSEALFFYPGYAITKRWKSKGVGKEYFDFISEGKNESSNNGNE